jgi:hypothetical protein
MSAQRTDRQNISITVRSLHDRDDATDRAYWRGVSPEEKMSMVWEMVLEYQAWRYGDVHQPRLQRSVCRVERRQR